MRCKLEKQGSTSTAPMAKYRTHSSKIIVVTVNYIMDFILPSFAIYGSFICF